MSGTVGPLLVGGTVLAIGICFGDNAGYAFRVVKGDDRILANFDILAPHEPSDG